jgi:hypothetical protein
VNTSSTNQVQEHKFNQSDVGENINDEQAMSAKAGGNIFGDNIGKL